MNLVSKQVLKYASTAIILTALITGAVLVGRKFRRAEEIRDGSSPKERGLKNAQILMEVYSDFQCPACRNALPVIHELEQKYAPHVKVVFRQFPLEHHHKWALLAAHFAECASRQGKFWEFHDRLYETQADWSKLEDAAPYFAGIAREVGLKHPAMEACLSDEKGIRDIREERKGGEQRGVQSTPTIFVANEPFVGGVQLKERGAQGIEKELERLGIKK